MPLATSFDVMQFLQTTNPNPLIELGPGPRPVAESQPDVPYIGIEVHMRRSTRPATQVAAERAIRARRGVPTIFINHDLGEDYNPTTILPDGAAGVMFMSNVAGDPMVADHPERAKALLQEFSRLMSDVGVIRETCTPTDADLGEAALAAAGLRVLARVNFSLSEWQTWKALERRYSGPDRPDPKPGSFYLFVGKIASA